MNDGQRPFRIEPCADRGKVRQTYRQVEFLADLSATAAASKSGEEQNEGNGEAAVSVVVHSGAGLVVANAGSNRTRSYVSHPTFLPAYRHS